jgi:predicted DNA-binding protein
MEKEKTDKLVSFAMRQSMYDKLNKICEKDFKTISEMLRELVVKKIREEEKNK